MFDLREILKADLLKAAPEPKKEAPPFYVGLVVIDSSRKFLLLAKRKEDNLWTGPGGGAAIGENPKEAAIREAYEESNLKLTPRQLKELPSLIAANGKMIHCFMAFVDKKEIKNLHTANDPDAEVRKWEWFKLNDPLPGKTDTNRLLTINAAKMRVLKLKKAEEELAGNLRKAMVSNPQAEIDINTAEESQNEIAAEDNEWVGILEKELSDYKYGENPREVPLPNQNILYISKVDDGLYSGFVRNNDPQDGEYGTTLVQLQKMTIISVVQSLKAKGYIPREEKRAEVEDQMVLEKPEQKQELASILSQFSPNELHIHIHKSLLEELEKVEPQCP